MPERTLHPQDGRQEMTSSDAVGAYAALDAACIRVWIDGGWAVDALLGRQLRPHQDLDIALERSAVRRLREILAAKGYQQVRDDGEWNLVLADDEGHEIDVHVFVCDERGNIVDGIRYPSESLTGTGTLEGHVVRCISAKHMVAFLAPWIHKWPDKYVPAVSALCEKFGIELPAEYLEFVTLGPVSPPVLVLLHNRRGATVAALGLNGNGPRCIGLDSRGAIGALRAMGLVTA